MVSRGVLLCFIVVLASIQHARGSSNSCPERGTCSECISSGDGKCDWIPARFSCAPRLGEDDFLSGLQRVSNSCEGSPSFQVPPVPFRHVCEEGGILTGDPNEPFGTYCACPRHYAGSKCQICTTETECGSGQRCMRNIRGLDAGESRSLSCECDSDFCRQIGFGPGQGVVNVQMIIGDTPASTFARIDILKGVDRPGEIFHSPVVIRASLSHCTSGNDVPCSQACGTTACPKDVPWTDEETCRVYDCEGPPENPPSSTYTTCPPKADQDNPWSVYDKDCSVVRSVMHPPFQFVCVVPKDPNMPLVDGKIRCGFSTFLLSQGSIALQCQIGSCEEPRITASPTFENKTSPTRKGFESYLVCSGNYGDQDCWNTYYFLTLLVPSIYSLTIIFAAMTRDRSIKSAIQATRILRSHLLEPSEDVETNAETDDFLQRPASTQSVNSSPVLSFSNVSFGVHDSTAMLDPSGRRVGSVRMRRRGFRTVLHNISGHVRSGELCAIMGPSGSGKTSLLDILAGRKNLGKIAGQVFLDGISVSPADLRDCVGYVTQDDVLPATSTVRELLLFHAALRGNSTMPLLTQCERVQDVLEELGLVTCADAMVGGPDFKSISGGERRRTSIACELLGEHTRLLVMDEPTSGLDSSSTQSVITALQTVVERERKTVVLSIHQPSTALFKRFSRVILLSATGRLLFCGPLDALETFFPPFPTGTNPAEYLIDLCVGDSDEAFRQASERYETSQVKAEQTTELRALLEDANASGKVMPSAHKPSLRLQIVELSTRAVRNAWRHPVLAATNVLATLFVAISCGLLYRGVTNDLQGAINRAGLFFFFLCFLMLASIADLGVFQEERLVLMRERASGAYSALAWFISKVFVEILLLRMAPLAITTFVLTGLVGLNQHPQAVLALFALLLIISLTATLQFLCLGMLFTQSGVANFSAILLTMFSLLMSGFLLQFDGTGASPSDHSKQTKPTETSGFEFLQSFSVLHFGFEALMVNELHGLNFQIVVKAPDGSEMTRVSASGDLILAQLGFVYERFANDVGTVFVFFAVFSILALLLLQFAVVERR